MSTLFKTVLSKTVIPLIDFKRYRGKINIQRPRKPHYERALVNAVTSPIYPEEEKNQKCFTEPEFKKFKEPNPYNDIIAREVQNWLRNSEMVAIFHLNSISSDDIFKVRVALHKNDMHLKVYGKAIMKKATENTKYEAILPLFDSNNCIVFSPQKNVAKLLKITKKTSQLILLAGIVENTLLSCNEFKHYASLPDLQMLRSQFVGILNSVAGQLVNNIETHQKGLVNILDVYAKSEDNINKDDILKT